MIIAPIANIIKHFHILYTVSHLIISATPLGRYYDLFLFYINEETEAQKGYLACPLLRSGKWQYEI